MKIFIEKLQQLPVSSQKIEICERKGIGHPDSLTDIVCENASRMLSNYYIERKGFICHHNLDKGLAVGGTSHPVFGDGEVVEPPDMIVAGTATIFEDLDEIKKLIYEETQNCLEKNLRFVEKLRPKIIVKIHPGSPDLVNLFERFSKGEMPLANDTSFGVAFEPMSKLENIVYNTERILNSDKIKKKFPFIGEDIKIMGFRNNDKISLTVAVAFVSQFINNLREYYEQKEVIKELIKKEIGEGEVSVNTADKDDSIYLTVTGTSWECGDDGQVGRGNRANGLITPCRPMSLEAVAGKNPISHVGKIYNLKAREIANKINENFEIEEVYVFLLSQIGKPINEPIVGVRYISDSHINEKKIVLNKLLVNIYPKTVLMN